MATARKPPKRAAASAPAAALPLGAVLAVPLDDGRFTACQVVELDGDGAVVVDLRWIGDAPPTLDALAKAAPLRLDHHAWTGALAARHVPASMALPPTWRVVGVEAPRAIGPCNSHGGWGGVGLQIALQARWDALPAAARAAYKAAKDDLRAEITLDLGRGPATIRVSASQALVDEGSSPVAWSALDRLPCVTDLAFEGRDPAVLDELRARPMIDTFSWRGHGREAIDLGGLDLREVGLFVEAPLHVTLPASTRELRVSGDASLLTVSQRGDGRLLSLTIPGDARLPVHGLPALADLSIVNAERIEVTALAAHPGLERLHLHGEAVTVPDVEGLAALGALRVLELFHVYGVDAARLPIAREAWPALSVARVDGFRKEDAARWKACFAGVATFALRGGKADAWLAANLGNPFRDWDERAPAAFRAATAAWRKARAALGEGVTAAEAEAALRAMIEAFNALEAKHGLDTVDCEEIGDAFFELARLGGVASAQAEAWFERWREL